MDHGSRIMLSRQHSRHAGPAQVSIKKEIKFALRVCYFYQVRWLIFIADSVTSLLFAWQSENMQIAATAARMA
jgi:hypothetical protein